MKFNLLKVLFAFLLTAASTFVLSLHLKVAAMPDLEANGPRYLISFFLPYCLIVAAFYAAYRLRVLEAALLGYYVSIILAVLYFFRHYSRLQTEGTLFVVYITPGILIYIAMKILQANYDSLRAVNEKTRK